MIDARSLKTGDSFTLTTAAGSLDIRGTPARLKCYEARRAPRAGRG